MTRPPVLSRPVVSPILVGREEQLAQLAPLLGQVVGGAGATVLVSGEAGIGKSRLVADIARRFRVVVTQHDADVLVGRCFEPDHALPFAPLLDLLRGWLAQQPAGEVIRRLGSAAPEIMRLLPELTPLLPDTQPLPALGPEDERRRISWALLDIVSRAASRRPLLLIVEDLHWSDDASLEFLVLLARQMPRLAALLVLTYRDDEVRPGLRRVLAALDRERLAAELALDRLSLEQVDLMLRAIFDQPLPIRRDFLLEVHHLTGGNPFFIEEVVRALMAAGDIYPAQGRWQRKEVHELRIPRSVHDAIQRRAEGLSREAHQVLRVAAVGGQRVAFSELQAVVAMDEGALLDALRELVDAQLLVEEAGERFAFRHALTREAIHAGLLGRERRLLHRAFGDAIERLAADVPEMRVADLAYHFHAAEAWEAALTYAQQAGEHALALYAPDAAIEHFSRAIDAAARLGMTPPAAVLHGRARAYATLGEFGHAEHDLRLARDDALRTGDRIAAWQALLDLGGIWVGRDYPLAEQETSRALAVAREIGDERMIARSYLQRANCQVNAEMLDDAHASLVAALAGFEQASDAQGVALALDLLGIVADLSGDVASMRWRLEQALERYRRLDDRVGMASVLATLSCCAGLLVYDADVVPLGMSYQDGLRCVGESLAIARQIGWRAGEAYALLATSGLHLHRGQYGLALEAASAGTALAEELAHQEWLALGRMVKGVIEYELLDLDAARATLTAGITTSHASGSMHFYHAIVANLACVCIAQGDMEAASATLAGVGQAFPMRAIGQRLLWLARGRLALALGDAEQALAIADQLLATALGQVGPGAIPKVEHLRGEALIALGRGLEAEGVLLAARDGALSRGMLPAAAPIHVSLGALYAATGRSAEAERESNHARLLIHRFAAGLEDNAARQRFIERALAGLPAPAATSATTRRLTARELEVARFVAAGKSNREIADALFIGTRTVESHVGHILGKLGFTSRAQIAAWVAEQRGTAGTL